MRYQVIKDIEVKTPAGTVRLSQGQIIQLDRAEAISLIEDGIIMPTNRVAYKVYSNILQAYLWVVQDLEELKTKDLSEPVYTEDEIRKLKGMDKESLQAIHLKKMSS